jgi:HPt (histidine-containing phosphotransfer) domain-containing protein
MMDGFAATRAIRNEEEKTGTHIPIIAMTAHAMKGDRELCLEAGMDAYISKPVRARDLFSTIEKLLTSSSKSSSTVNEQFTPVKNMETAESEPVPTSSSEMTPKEVFDWDKALQQSDVGSKILREMAEMFLIESKKLLDQLRDALAKRDAPGVRRAAHTLKGSAVVLAAKPASEAAMRLESIAANHSLVEAESAYRRLEEEVARLCRAIVEEPRIRQSTEEKT